MTSMCRSSKSVSFATGYTLRQNLQKKNRKFWVL